MTQDTIINNRSVEITHDTEKGIVVGLAASEKAADANEIELKELQAIQNPTTEQRLRILELK